MVQAILSGLLVVVVITLAPRGIAGLLRSGAARLRARTVPARVGTDA
jgi:hypothetical protein